MIKKTIKGLGETHENYDAFFIDLWGVIHNGVKLYPRAIEVLVNLYKIKKRLWDKEEAGKERRPWIREITME